MFRHEYSSDNLCSCDIHSLTQYITPMKTEDFWGEGSRYEQSESRLTIWTPPSCNWYFLFVSLQTTRTSPCLSRELFLLLTKQHIPSLLFSNQSTCFSLKNSNHNWNTCFRQRFQKLLSTLYAYITFQCWYIDRKTSWTNMQTIPTIYHSYNPSYNAGHSK